MPKTDNPLMKAKTSPGVSYTVPTAKLVEAVSGDDFHTFLMELDPLEEALIDAAFRDVIEATVPGYRGASDLPVILWRGRTCLRVSGQFPPVLKGPDGKLRQTVKAGATVTMRTMLKCYPSAKGVTVFAFPSRIDVQGKAPAKRTTKPTSQLAMALPLPVKTVVAPAPIRKPEPPEKAPAKAKPGPKTKPSISTRAVAQAVRFDMAAFAAERARIVEARLRAKKAMSGEATKALKPAQKPKTKPAPAMPSNVIVFPLHRTRKAS